MNILFTNIFFVGFMVFEIPRVSIFGHSPYSVTFLYVLYHVNNIFLVLWKPFIPSRNLDYVFTYNRMALMSLRSRSRVKGRRHI